MKLYEIERNYLAALDFFTDPETEIQVETVNDTLEAIEGEFEQKAVAIAAFLRGMEKEAEAIEDAEKQMVKRRKALESRARWLRDYLKTGMETIGLKKIPSKWFILSIQKNPASVDVFNQTALPEEFKVLVTEIRINKTAIRDAINDGREIPGARLTNGTRLAIR